MAALTPVPKIQFFTANGEPLVGGKLYSYAAGTTTPLVTYTDQAGTSANTNPVILDSRGEASVWLGTGPYKLRLTSATDVDIWTVDDIYSEGSQSMQELLSASGSSLVGFIADGTGAAYRTVQSKLRDVVSVKDFGAVGDGTTDDTAAIQAFFNACQNGRGYMPAGIYKITSTLNLYPQYSYNIEGSAYRNTANSGTVIYNAGTSTAILVDNDPYTPPNFDSQIRLANMTVSGNASSQHGIYTQHAMIHLENMWITGHGGHGLYLERAYSSAFRQVTCANNYKNGCLIGIAGNALHFDHCVFNGNSITDGYAGLYMNALPDPLSENFGVVFTSCDFTSNGQTVGVTTAYGAIVQKSFAASFIGCYWEGNKAYNLYADSSAKNLSVIGCYFQEANSSISQVEGLVYENNFHLRVSATTQIDIVGGMPTSRLPARMFGNTYSGGATSNPTAGVTENVQLWYSSIPSGGTWKRGDIIWNSNFQAGGQSPGWTCVTAGTPGTWLPMPPAPSVYENWGDSDATLTAFSSFPTNFWQSPLTANRTVTLSTTGAVSGSKFRIVRAASSTGAFSLNVGSGPLKSLSAGQWCDVEYTGSAWALSAFGSL